jgi:hypothetical protein
MQSANLAARTHRQSESGLVWEEKLSGATGTIIVKKFSTIRVRATGATTVTIDGVLAMTMTSGEIAVMNVGSGDNDDSINTVDVVIAAAAAYVQVARDIDRPKILT